MTVLHSIKSGTSPEVIVVLPFVAALIRDSECSFSVEMRGQIRSFYYPSKAEANHAFSALHQAIDAWYSAQGVEAQ